MSTTSEEKSMIVLNRIRTPDGTVLTSRNRHDYRTHLDANGETYMVDGGSAYLRRNVNKEAADELSVYVEDGHEMVRMAFEWGTRGVDGRSPLRYVAVKDMSTDHIIAVMTTQRIGTDMLGVFEAELDWREDHEA